MLEVALKHLDTALTQAVMPLASRWGSEILGSSRDYLVQALLVGVI